ncbi:uncharacterized protein MICPUCDRAFT_42647 [Micromonas pusilla CCMP1545]|uniref:Predicted protein n=1 Tax=Micromonas pusilla (strain CCMP1545) TaxID=564608 RepID=C1N5K3_MICPC|nr:uncharacterized protein MICPUCDRAFT_42647 [Micromonas pusilla CCMP1545]EEH52308.1 predicted protein [Micromonas pusilla CCMP1545]|eukprot:XP_003063172.1 predicted protein [Micromonas pusilla CCMP1545]
MKVPRRPPHPLLGRPGEPRQRRTRHITFDDQRPGWDDTTSDLKKWKLSSDEVEAKKALHQSKNLVRGGVDARGSFTVRPGRRPLSANQRVFDRSRSRSTSPSKRGGARDAASSPARVRGRNGDAGGAGLGPVRFEPRRRAKDDDDESKPPSRRRDENGRPVEPRRPTPLDHEHETSAGPRRMTEPPALHNPRAGVAFAEAPRPKSPAAQGARKSKAVGRAKVRPNRDHVPRQPHVLTRGNGINQSHAFITDTWIPSTNQERLGFVATRAPEFGAGPPNGGGAAARARKIPSGPTVDFDREYEQFKMKKLKAKLLGGGPGTESVISTEVTEEEETLLREAFEDELATSEDEPDYDVLGDEKDFDLDDDVSDGDFSEDEDDAVAEKGRRAALAKPSPAKAKASEASKDKNKSKTDGVAAQQSALLKQHERVKRSFGIATEGGGFGGFDAKPPPAVVRPVRTWTEEASSGSGDESDGSVDAARVSPAPSPRAPRDDDDDDDEEAKEEKDDDPYGFDALADGRHPARTAFFNALKREKDELLEYFDREGAAAKEIEEAAAAALASWRRLGLSCCGARTAAAAKGGPLSAEDQDEIRRMFPTPSDPPEVVPPPMASAAPAAAPNPAHPGNARFFEPPHDPPPPPETLWPLPYDADVPRRVAKDSTFPADTIPPPREERALPSYADMRRRRRLNPAPAPAAAAAASTDAGEPGSHLHKFKMGELGPDTETSRELRALSLLRDELWEKVERTRLYDGDDEVLKERRSPRERGRMGSRLTDDGGETRKLAAETRLRADSATRAAAAAPPPPPPPPPTATARDRDRDRDRDAKAKAALFDARVKAAEKGVDDAFVGEAWNAEAKRIRAREEAEKRERAKARKAAAAAAAAVPRRGDGAPRERTVKTGRVGELGFRAFTGGATR